MFTKNELIFIYDLLGRAQISGNEAENLLNLRKKMATMLTTNPEQAKPAEVQKEETKTE